MRKDSVRIARKTAVGMDELVREYIREMKLSSGLNTQRIFAAWDDASGAARFEWEKEIPVEDVKALLDLAEPGVIDKTRYLVKNTDGVHTWEVDEFYGDNDGLTVAEVELADENEPFDKPAWLGEEVTGDPKYFNSMLMKNPYKNWK